MGKTAGSGRPIDFKRQGIIVALRKAGLTMHAIGQTFNPPITREAVRQQLNRAARDSLDTPKSARVESK